MGKLKVVNLAYEDYQALHSNLKSYINGDLSIKVLDKLMGNVIKRKYKDSWRSRWNNTTDNWDLIITELICYHYRLNNQHLNLEIKPGEIISILECWNLKMLTSHLKNYF